MIRFLRKLFPLLFILLLAGLGYYYRDKVMEQYRHAQGVYYIYKGDQAYSADNMGKTLEYYLKGLELYPGHYEAWFNLGNIYAVHEDYYSAVDAYGLQRLIMSLYLFPTIPKKNQQFRNVLRENAFINIRKEETTMISL